SAPNSASPRLWVEQTLSVWGGISASELGLRNRAFDSSRPASSLNVQRGYVALDAGHTQAQRHFGPNRSASGHAEIDLVEANESRRQTREIHFGVHSAHTHHNRIDRAREAIRRGSGLDTGRHRAQA